MPQRVIDFLASQTIRAKKLSRPTRFLRFGLFLLILAVPSLLCGFLVSFKVAFQMWLFLLAAIVPLVGGFFLIWKHQWNNQKTGFLLATGLLGFVAFELSLLGMLFDPRSINFSFQYILTVAFFIGFGFFIFSTIGSLLISKLIRVLNGKK